MSRALRPEDTHERQHPERMDEIGQRLGRVVGLHDPTEMHLQLIRRIEHVRRFDEPLAAGRRNEQTEERRVDADHHGIGVLVRDRHEEIRQLLGEPGLGEHAHDAGVHRILDQDAADRRHGSRDRLHERFRPPVQQQADDEEHEHVVIQLEQHARPVGHDFANEEAAAERRDHDREQGAVLEPLAGRRALADVARGRRVGDAHVAHRLRVRRARAPNRTRSPSIRGSVPPRCVKLCQSPSVWLSGMTPLMRSIASGNEAGAAMINAADDDRPSAQTLPTPRYAAAPIAR